MVLYNRNKLYKLVYIHNKVNTRTINKLGDLNFIPYFLLPDFYTQATYHETIPTKQVIYKREYIQNPHYSGLISLDWVVETEDCSRIKSTPSKNLLIICHGLAEGSDTLYVKDISDAFTKENYSIVCIHARGINDTPLTSPKVYNCNFTTDLKFSFNYLRKKYPDYNAFVIGASMGANLSYLTIAKNPEFSNWIKGYCSVSNFFDMTNSNKKCIGSLHEKFLLKNLKKYISKHQDMFNIDSKKYNYSTKDLLKSDSMTTFNTEVVLKPFSYKSHEEYHNLSSSSNWIDKINVRTLILIAENDPIVSFGEEEEKKGIFII